MKYYFRKVENMVKKGENAGFPAFSPFPFMFLKGFSPLVDKSGDCIVLNVYDTAYFPFLTLYRTIETFNDADKESLKKIVEKKEMLFSSIFSSSQNFFDHLKENIDPQ